MKGVKSQQGGYSSVGRKRGTASSLVSIWSREDKIKMILFPRSSAAFPGPLGGHSRHFLGLFLSVLIDSSTFLTDVEPRPEYIGGKINKPTNHNNENQNLLNKQKTRDSPSGCLSSSDRVFWYEF